MAVTANRDSCACGVLLTPEHTVSLPFASSGHIITPGLKEEARQQPRARGLPDSLTSFLLTPVAGTEPRPVPGALRATRGHYHPNL